MIESPFNITNHFFQSARNTPDKIAIVDGEGQITFEELEQQVKETADYFISRGIQKGDRVLVFIPMSTRLYTTVLALFYMGAVAVFLDEWVSFRRLNESCRVAQCRGFIGSWKANILGFFSNEIRKIPIHLGQTKKSDGGHSTISEVFPSDTALLTFTTGSTGTPKAARRTHGFLDEQFKALSEKIDPQPGDIDMPVLPVVLLLNLGTGCTSVIAKYNPRKPASLNPVQILDQITQYKVSRVVASPFFVKQISKYVLEHNANVPSSLRKIFTGGAPVFRKEAALYTRAFPSTVSTIVYGSTEAEPISSVTANELCSKSVNQDSSGLWVGIPYHKTTVRIIPITDSPVHYKTEEALQQTFLPISQIGEIIVSGPHVLRHYFNNDQAIARNKIMIGENCWHRTGDSGFLGADGSLFLTGRCSSLIYRNGEIISPFIVEDLLLQIEGVEMATIIEVRDKLLIVVQPTNVVAKDSISTAILKAEITHDEVKFIKEIPRDPRHHSKVDYGKLLRKLR